MTVNSKMPSYTEEVNGFTNDPYIKSRFLSIAQRAFADGVTSILSCNNVKSKSNIDAVRNINENLSDYYIDKNMESLYEYFLNIIKNITSKGKLQIGYEDSAKEDFRNIVKAVYDMGLIAGVQLSKDPLQLEIFLKNKDNIENGEY